MSATAMLWIAGALIACVGVALAAWALLADRARGRTRCPKCWYDMSGAPSAASVDGDASVGPLRCPECGREIKHARQLARTRRRWRWALVAALLLLVATGCFITGKAKRDGWESVTPTTALILIAQWSDDPWALNVLAPRVLYNLGTPRNWKTELPRMWGWQSRWGLQIMMECAFNRASIGETMGLLSFVRSIQEAGNLDGKVERSCLEDFVHEGLKSSNEIIRARVVEIAWNLDPADPLRGEAEDAVMSATDKEAFLLVRVLADLATEYEWARQQLVQVILHAQGDDCRRFAITAVCGWVGNDIPERDQVAQALSDALNHDPDDSVRTRAKAAIERIERVHR